MFALNPFVRAVVEPPIAEAKGWVSGRAFPTERPLLDVAQAVPSYPPDEGLRAHLGSLTGRFETAQYTEIAGTPPLREAIAEHTRKTYPGATVDASNVVVTAGCNQAYCLATMALARAGDEVLLPLPYYFNHQMWLDALGVRAVHMPFRADRSGVPDPADAEARITPRTRAIVLVTPSNPTGAVIPPGTLAEFRDLAERHGIALLLDETYRDFLPHRQAPHALLAADGWGESVVQLYSFSKAYSLTGYRVGCIVAGNAFTEQVAKLMDCVSICTSRIAQEGALYALQYLEEWSATRIDMIAERRRALVAEFEAGIDGYELVASGAYFAWVRHPHGGEPASTVARRLAEDSAVLCLPGSVFGGGQEDYLRFAVANLEAGRMPDLGARLRAAAATG